MTKEAEVRVRDLTNHYLWYRHKYGDVRYCAVCHSAQPKSENAPDFYVAQVGQWIEAKNIDSSGTWLCSEIMEGGARINQRNFLNKNGGWLFLDFSEGRKLDEKAAYLVPWGIWVEKIEPILVEKNMKSIGRLTTYNKDKSIRRLGANILFSDYKLKWQQGVGWIIPPSHIWWKSLEQELEKQLQIVREEQCSDD